MLQPVAGTGRLQVGQEQIPECRLGRWGAEQPEHRLPLGAFRYVMEVRKAGVQVEVALLEATCALHQLQRRVHALPDEQRLYWGVRVVAGLDAPPGKNALAGMVGEQGLHLQFCPVFPLHRRAAGTEQGIDALLGEQDAHGPGVAYLHRLRAQLLDLPGMVEYWEGHGERGGLPGIPCPEQAGLPVPEDLHACIAEHGVGDGCLLEPQPPGDVAPWMVGVGAAGEVERETAVVILQQELLPLAGQPVPPQTVPVMGLDEALPLEPGDELFAVAGGKAQYGQYTGAALPGDGGQLHETVRAGCSVHSKGSFPCFYRTRLLLRQNLAGTGLYLPLYWRVFYGVFTAVRLFLGKTAKNPICFFPSPPALSAIRGSGSSP